MITFSNWLFSFKENKMKAQWHLKDRHFFFCELLWVTFSRYEEPCLFLEAKLITPKQVQFSPPASLPDSVYFYFFDFLMAVCEQINPVNVIKGFIVTQIYTNSLIITPFHLTDFFENNLPHNLSEGKWPCIKRREEMNANTHHSLSFF